MQSPAAHFLEAATGSNVQLAVCLLGSIEDQAKLLAPKVRAAKPHWDREPSSVEAIDVDRDDEAPELADLRRRLEAAELVRSAADAEASVELRRRLEASEAMLASSQEAVEALRQDVAAAGMATEQRDAALQRSAEEQ